VHRPTPLPLPVGEGGVRVSTVAPCPARPKRKARPSGRASRIHPDETRPYEVAVYFRCLLTSLVISNIDTCFLPPNTPTRLASALIMRLFLASCSLFFLMYTHSFFVTSVRGSGFDPTTMASAALGIIGFMNAALGFRLAPDFFAVFFAVAFFVVFFFVAILMVPF
jgi:hypothetical protein